MASERQCRTHIATHHNSTELFKLKIEGYFPAPVMEVQMQVQVQRSLLEHLPSPCSRTLRAAPHLQMASLLHVSYHAQYEA